MRSAVCFIAALCFTFSVVALEDFNNPFTPDSNTRGLWHFDETSGVVTFQDASSNDNDGTLSTGLPLQLNPNLSWVASKSGFGNCVKAWYNSTADNNQGAMEVPQWSGHSTLGFSTSENITIEFWMKPDNGGASSGGNILRKYTGGDYIVWYKDNKLGYSWYSGGWQSAQDTTAIPAGDWTHVAITVDRTSDPAKDTISFYINGMRSTSHETPYPGGDPNLNSLWILNSFDSNDTNYQFNGLLDELRISDILRDYPDTGGGGDEGPLVQFSFAISTAGEDSGTIDIQLALSEPCSQAVTALYSVTGTAIGNGVDYIDPRQSD